MKETIKTSEECLDIEKFEEEEMADIVSILISVVALVMSSLTALVGLIITWINSQREYDPMIVLGAFKIDDDSFKRVVRIKNLGRGTAFDVRVTIYDEQKCMYRANSIDLIPSNEYDNIPYELWRYPDKKHSDMMELINKNKTLLFHITFANENGRKKQTYYIGELIPDWYSKISKREFRKYKNSQS